MLMDQYYEAMSALVEKVRETQRDNIIKAGNMIADTVEKGGAVVLTQIVHGVEGDVLYRGGGPRFYSKLAYGLNITESSIRPRDMSGKDTNTEGLAKYYLKKANLKAGDVLFVSSVSGRTASVVDLAYEATQMGIKVIALMSMEYASTVDAVHSSGKKMYEFVDLVIDNCAPPAEALLDVEGLDAKFGACSGISSDYIMWFITSCAVEELMKRGITPGILKSANFPGGMDYDKNVIEPHYQEFGW